MDREDLEKKAKEIATKWKAFGVPYNAIYDAVMEIANWQRQKDEHLIWQTSTANYEKGIEEGKQQMMKDAQECKVIEYFDRFCCKYIKEIPHSVPENLKDGDNVKLIIVKED